MTPGPENNSQCFRDWIINWLVEQLDLQADKIDLKESLLLYGMDSVNAIMLVGDLESQFQLRLPPTLVWDHPSVDALVKIVMSSSTEQSLKPNLENKNQAANPNANPVDQQEAAQLLENIDQLSEAEMDQLLKRLAGE